MIMPPPDIYYEISDERLIAYSRVPLLGRLKWLDEVRCFTLAVRAAPTVETAGLHNEQPEGIDKPV